jgi:hypothetical protein
MAQYHLSKLLVGSSTTIKRTGLVLELLKLFQANVLIKKMNNYKHVKGQERKVIKYLTMSPNYEGRQAIQYVHRNQCSKKALNGKQLALPSSQGY